MFENKKILVTGGLGFIGRTLLETLIKYNCGAKLYAIDLKQMPEDAELLKKNIDFQMLDIRNENAVKSYISANTFDGIVHLAAVSRVVDAEKDKSNCIETNYKGTKYIAEATAENPCCWMIFGSSREVYGEQTVFPVKESDPKKPINIYGKCKLEGERLVAETINLYAILRFCNVYGNVYDIHDRVIPKFIINAIQDKPFVLEGGNQIIDFTHVNDTVRSIVKVMELLQGGCIEKEIIHISPGFGVPIAQLAQSINHIIGKTLPILRLPPRTYDVQRFVGDTTHRICLLGNDPFLTIDEGLSQLIAQIKELPQFQPHIRKPE